MAERIFLDQNRCAPVSPNAISACMPFFQESFAPHELFAHIESAKKNLYELFGASTDDQCVFTASGQEAISMAIYSAYHVQTKQNGKNHFTLRAIDEAASFLACQSLADDGCYLKLAPTQKRGFVTQADLIESISPRTAMVSLSWACTLTGVIQPLEEIAEVCQDRAIWLHVDATHVVGKLAFSFADLPVDILTFDGSGFHAPRGSGGLFAKKNIPLRPVVFGAELNVPLLVALGESARLARETQSLYCTEVSRLRGQFEEAILAACPGSSILFSDEERVPQTSNISFAGIHAELLAYALSSKGVFVSRGGYPLPPMEKVLEACGIEPELARTALAFSISKDTQEHELERAVAKICDRVMRLSRISEGIA